METIAEEVFNSNSDYAVRKRCQDREDYLRWQATYKNAVGYYLNCVSTFNQSLISPFSNLNRLKRLL